MTPGAGVRAKVARALELLLVLDQELHEYLDTDPIALVQHIQPGGHEIAVALRVTTPPPIQLSVLVGEVAHQLRSALDHLAYLLVCAAGNEPNRRTSFPVLTARPVNALQIQGGVSPLALSAVRELQPYQRKDPQAHPLHLLTTLWNVDKHRHLNLTVLRATNTQAFLSAPDGSALLGGQLRSGTIDDGDIMAVFEFAEEVDPSWELTASGSNFLAFGESGPWPKDKPVQLVLESLHEYVALVVLPRLEPLL